MKHSQKLATAQQKLILLELKLENKNGKNNINILLQEHRIRTLISEQKMEALNEEIRLILIKYLFII